MARDRGHVNRTLVGIKIDGNAAISPGAKLFREGTEVGHAVEGRRDDEAVVPQRHARPHHDLVLAGWWNIFAAEFHLARTNEPDGPRALYSRGQLRSGRLAVSGTSSVTPNVNSSTTIR